MSGLFVEADRITSGTKHGLVKGRPSGGRPLSVRSGTIAAEGKVIKLGRQTSYTEGFVRDGAGNLAVHATATFSMIEVGSKSK